MSNEDDVEEAMSRMLDKYRINSSISIELALREAFIDGAQFALDSSTRITNKAFENMLKKIHERE